MKKLSDSSIAQLVRVLQLAILTGTDVSDNIRQMQFVEEDDLLVPDPDYLDIFEANLERLQNELPATNPSPFSITSN